MFLILHPVSFALFVSFKAGGSFLFGYELYCMCRRDTAAVQTLSYYYHIVTRTKYMHSDSVLPSSCSQTPAAAHQLRSRSQGEAPVNAGLVPGVKALAQHHQPSLPPSSHPAQLHSGLVVTVAVGAVELCVSDADVGAAQAVAQRCLAHAAPEAGQVVQQLQTLDDHGRAVT